MAQARIVVGLEVEGRPLDRSPYVVTSAAPIYRQFSFVLEDYGGYQAPLCTLPPVVTTLVFTTTQAITVRLNGQADGGLALTAGGVCVLANVALDVLPLWTILNVSGQATRIRGLCLGAES